MDRVRLYLRAPLFALKDDATVPRNATIIDGHIQDRPSGGLLVKVEAFADGDGNPLKGGQPTIFLPLAKLDYALVREEK